MDAPSFITGALVGAFAMLGILVWLAYKFDGKQQADYGIIYLISMMTSRLGWSFFQGE